MQNLFIAAFIAGPRGFVGQGGTPAQQVVQTGAAQGDWLAVGSARPRAWARAGVAAAAVTRFAALSPAARHAWLATHLAALRAGHITLAQLP